MSEQASTSTDSSLSSVEVNLTQLNAFNQYIVSRTAVMLTAGGLAAAVGGIIERFHPDVDKVAPGITPWLLYMAAILIPLSAVLAFFNLLLDHRLQSLLTERFGEEVQTGEPVQISKEDFENLKRSRARKVKSLDISFVLLLLGTTALVFHVYELFISDEELLTTLSGFQIMNKFFVVAYLLIGTYTVRRLLRRLKRLSQQS